MNRAVSELNRRMDRHVAAFLAMTKGAFAMTSPSDEFPSSARRGRVPKGRERALFPPARSAADKKRTKERDARPLSTAGKTAALRAGGLAPPLPAFCHPLPPAGGEGNGKFRHRRGERPVGWVSSPGL
jgi:hypothetical protein